MSSSEAECLFEQVEKKRKIVRFADMEGKELYETFFIARLSNSKCIEKKCRKEKTKQNETLPLVVWNNCYIQERLRERFVTLESFATTNNGIIGRIAVTNIAYAKDVSVAYSFDDWSTAFPTKASFYRHDEANNIDFFFFAISKKSHTVDPKWQISFAICYKVCGCEFWDNNNGNNYIVMSH